MFAIMSFTSTSRTPPGTRKRRMPTTIGPAKARDACEAQYEAHTGGRTGGLCTKLIGMLDSVGGSLGRGRLTMKGCEEAFLSKDCLRPGHKGENRDTVICRTRQKLLAAARGQRVEECGGDVVCRAAVLHSAAECEPLVKKVVADYCSTTFKAAQLVETKDENDFRKVAGLPKWKLGDPVLHRLPAEQRAKYEKKTETGKNGGEDEEEGPGKP